MYMGRILLLLLTGDAEVLLTPGANTKPSLLPLPRPFLHRGIWWQAGGKATGQLFKGSHREALAPCSY